MDTESWVDFKSKYDVSKNSKAETGYGYAYQVYYGNTNRWNRDNSVKMFGNVKFRKVWSTKRMPNKKKKVEEMTPEQIKIAACLRSKEGKKFIRTQITASIIEGMTKRVFQFQNTAVPPVTGAVYKVLAGSGAGESLLLGDLINNTSGLQTLVTGLELTCTVAWIGGTVVVQGFLLQRKSVENAANPLSTTIAGDLLIPGSYPEIKQFSSFKESQYKIIEKFRICSSSAYQSGVFSQTYPSYRFRKIQLAGSATLSPKIYDGEIMIALFPNTEGISVNFNGQLEFFCQ